jgi:hypothetical protein
MLKTKEAVSKAVTDLLSTHKLRISPDRLEWMLEQETPTSDLLVLLTDVTEFVRSIEAEPLLDHLKVIISDTGIEKWETLEKDLIVIFTDELPGPMARLNVAWGSLSHMAEWESVEVIEEMETYSLF